MCSLCTPEPTPTPTAFLCEHTVSVRADYPNVISTGLMQAVPTEGSFEGHEQEYMTGFDFADRDEIQGGDGISSWFFEGYGWWPSISLEPRARYTFTYASRSFYGKTRATAGSITFLSPDCSGETGAAAPSYGGVAARDSAKVDTTEEKVGHPDTWSNQLIDMLGAALMTSVCGILVVSLMLIAVLYVGLSRRPAQVYTRVTGRLSRAEMGKARVWPEDSSMS